MKKLCVIPARGGSKRIPRKNIRSFFDKPMISYSIKAALESNIFDRVIVSTDDEEISQVARYYGAEVPFIRPASLSDDMTGAVDVIIHAIESCEDAYKICYEQICCLYATAPFVQSKYIIEGSWKLSKSEANFAISMTTFPFPIQRAVRYKEQFVQPLSQADMQKRSQDLEEAYHDAGQFCWGTREAWLEKRDIWSHHITPVFLPRFLVQDIDTIEDWQQAEIMYGSVMRRSVEVA